MVGIFSQYCAHFCNDLLTVHFHRFLQQLFEQIGQIIVHIPCTLTS